MQTEDLVVDESSKGKVVEEIGKVFPDVRITVFSEAFVVETVDLSDLTGFVVTTEDGDALRITDFEGHEEGHCLDGEVTSVDVVTW